MIAIHIETFGHRGVWHRCRQPEHFDTLVKRGWRRCRDSVEANVMSGIPAKTYKALGIEWPAQD